MTSAEEMDNKEKISVEDDALISSVEKNAMDLLKAALSDMGLPPLVDRTLQPRSPDKDAVTIVIVPELGIEAWGVFFEGIDLFQCFFYFIFFVFIYACIAILCD